MDYNNLESLLLLLVELLTARNLFDEFLDYDFIVVLSLARCNFDVVV